MAQGSAGQVRDGRLPPFCFQTHSALDAIRAVYDEPATYGKLTTALAVYLVFTEAANRHGGAGARAGFRKQRGEIAALAGVSKDTLDSYVAVLIEAGVLAVERERVGEVALPNVWTLLDPVSAGTPPGGARSATLAAPTPPLARGSSLEQETTPKKEELSPPTPPSSPFNEVRECWLAHSPPLTAHQAGYFDGKLARKIGKAVGAYGVGDVCAAIGAYAAVLASPEHFWNYRWPLAHFLDRGLDRFLPEADPFENFRIRQTDRRGDTSLSVGEMMRQAKEARDDRGTVEAVGRDARRGLPAAADQPGDV